MQAKCKKVSIPQVIFIKMVKVNPAALTAIHELFRRANDTEYTFCRKKTCENARDAAPVQSVTGKADIGNVVSAKLEQNGTYRVEVKVNCTVDRPRVVDNDYINKYMYSISEDGAEELVPLSLLRELFTLVGIFPSHQGKRVMRG